MKPPASNKDCKTRIGFCTIEPAPSRRFNFANVVNAHSVIVPTPFAGLSNRSLWSWWYEYGIGEVRERWGK